MVYVSDDGQYMLQGTLYDAANRKDLTGARLAVDHKNKVDAVPTSKRIVFAAEGKPKYKITVFTDLDCGYCRKLHSQIAQYNKAGIEVDYLFFPRSGLNSPSYDKAVSVWCAKDRNARVHRGQGRQDADAGQVRQPGRRRIQPRPAGRRRRHADDLRAGRHQDRRLSPAGRDALQARESRQGDARGKLIARRSVLIGWASAHASIASCSACRCVLADARAYGCYNKSCHDRPPAMIVLDGQPALSAFRIDRLNSELARHAPGCRRARGALRLFRRRRHGQARQRQALRSHRSVARRAGRRRALDRAAARHALAVVQQGDRHPARLRLSGAAHRARHRVRSRRRAGARQRRMARRRACAARSDDAIGRRFARPRRHAVRNRAHRRRSNASRSTAMP